MNDMSSIETMNVLEAILLNKLYQADGLAYAQPVSDVIATVFTLMLTLIALHQFRKDDAVSGQQPQPAAENAG